MPNGKEFIQPRRTRRPSLQEGELGNTASGSVDFAAISASSGLKDQLTRVQQLRIRRRRIAQNRKALQRIEERRAAGELPTPTPRTDISEPVRQRYLDLAKRLKTRLPSFFTRLAEHEEWKDHVRATTTGEGRKTVLKGVHRSDNKKRPWGLYQEAAAPLFAGILKRGETPQVRRAFGQEIDAYAEDSTNKLVQEALKNQGIDTNIVIVGAGQAAQVIAITLDRFLPQGVRVVIIDKGEVMGGNFADPGERDAYYLNHKNDRISTPDRRVIIGGDQNLSYAGRSALTQTAFAAVGSGYATNGDEARRIKTNLAFSRAEPMIHTNAVDLVTVQDIDSKGEKSYLKVSYQKSPNDVPFECDIRADIVLICSGLGEEQYNLDLTHQPTRELVEASKAGTDSRLIGNRRFWRNYGNPQNKYPAHKFAGKRVGVSGPADSGTITVQQLEFQGVPDGYGYSTPEDGRPAEVVLFGTSYETRDEAESCLRIPRYGGFIGLLPRKVGEEAPVKPNTRRMHRLESEGEQVRAFSRDADGILYDEAAFDVIVNANGYSDKSVELLKRFVSEDTTEITDPDRISKLIPKLSTVPGTIIKYNDASPYFSQVVVRDVIKDGKKGFVQLEVTSKGGRVGTEYRNLNIKARTNGPFDPSTIANLTYTVSPTEQLMEVRRSTGLFPNSLVARQVPGRNIFVIPPAGGGAGFTDEQKKQLPVEVSENVVAEWANGQAAEAAGKMVARLFKQR